MFFRNGFVFLFLMLSGCGISGLSHHKYVTFSSVNQSEKTERELFRSKGLFFSKVFTDKTQKYAGETKELVKESVAIEFAHSEGGFVGIFPFIPPPPYMPVFLDDVSPVCPIQSDLRMSIRYVEEESAFGEEKEISEHLKQPKINKIYLVKQDKTMIFPRHLWNEGYSYQICFPLTMEESDNAILYVDEIINQQDQKIPMMPQRLRYYDEYVLGMGYLGSLVRCDYDGLSAQEY